MGIRSLLLVLLLATVVASVAVPSPASGAPTDSTVPSAWARPVPGAVKRPFVAPRAIYGPGHRGVDFIAPPGTAVVAGYAGVVSFAGMVAGSLHVVIDHGDGLRTSSSFLARIDVHRGDRVVRGQVIGVAGGIGPEHAAGVFHFGLRVGETYVDPMKLFAPVDLAAVIRLVPAHAPDQTGLATPASETRSLSQALHIPRGIPGLEPPAEPDFWDQALTAGGDLLGGIVAVGGVLTWPGRTITAYVVDHTPLGAELSDLRAIGARFMTYLHNEERCNSDTAARPGGGGSGHLLMAVGGINSHTDPKTGRTFGLDTKALGYRADELSWFSYSADGRVYRSSDTWGDLVVQAYLLRNQLRALQVSHPGREVDLIAHSQGGVVVDAFMQLVYDPADSTLPPIGNYISLSSPHRGAPAASIAKEVRTARDGRRLLDAAESVAGGTIPPSGGRSTRQLAEDSSFMKKLWDRPLPDQVDMTSIAGDDDFVVPGSVTDAPGARQVTVDPGGIGDHSAIVTDSDAMREVRLALEQRPPACVGLLQGVRGAVEPVLIRRVELGLGYAVSKIARGRIPTPGSPLG